MMFTGGSHAKRRNAGDGSARKSSVEHRNITQSRMGPEGYTYRTRTPTPFNPADLPPSSSTNTYVYKTRVPRRVAEASALSSPAENIGGGFPITRRRGAVKQNKVHIIRGHKLVAKFFRQFTFCTFCKEFLW